MTSGNWICLFLGMASPGLVLLTWHLYQERKPKSRKVSQDDYYNICSDCANGAELPERFTVEQEQLAS